MCRVWYKGQPLICNLCGTPGHRSSDCLNKNKCCLCGAEGHFARSCPNPWGLNDSQATPSGPDAPADAGAGPSLNENASAFSTFLNANTSASGDGASLSENNRATDTSLAENVSASGIVNASVEFASSSNENVSSGDPELALQGASDPSQIATVDNVASASGELVGDSSAIEELTSSASSSSCPISDFSQESQSILADAAINSNCNDSNLNSDSIVTSDVISNTNNRICDNPMTNVDQTVRTSNEVDEASPPMDTSGASLKWKHTLETRSASNSQDSSHFDFARPSHPRSASTDGKKRRGSSRSSASPSPGRPSGLPFVSPRRPHKV